MRAAEKEIMKLENECLMKEKRLAIIHFADKDIFLRRLVPFFQKDSKECLTEGNGRAKVMKSLRAMVL